MHPSFLPIITFIGLVWLFIAAVTMLIMLRIPSERLRGSRMLWFVLIMCFPFVGMALFVALGQKPASSQPVRREPQPPTPPQGYDQQRAEEDLYSGPSEEVLDHLYGRDR